MVNPSRHVITYSSLGRFAACRRLWHWGEYLGLQKIAQTPVGPLPFGSRVHVAWEMWNKGEVAEPVDAWGPLMEVEYAYMAERGWNTKELDKESKEGFAMLSGLPDWLAAQGVYAKYSTVKVEHVMKDHLVIELIDGTEVEVQLQGRADEIVRRRSDGTYLVRDLKTSRQIAESVITVLAKSPQFPIYTHLAQQEHPELTFSGAQALILRKTQQSTESKIPYYALVDIPVSESSQAAYMARLKGASMDLVNVTRALDNGADPDLVAYFQPSRVSCVNCPFRAPCDLMASYPAGARDMLANEYEHHDPLERYGQNDEDPAIE